ncbi:MAG: S8 family serine peptidase, partial [Eubacteriales bacterium]|nr:S8 family serine peptidase [Eubacteriales bacterium]
MKIYTRLLAGFATVGLGIATIFSTSTANAAVNRVQAIQDAGGPMQKRVLTQAIDEMLSAGSYSEGEAIAVVRGSARPAVSGEAELLLQSGRDAVNGAIESGKKNGSLSADLARQRMAEEEDDAFSIWLVSDPGRTTQELLQALYADPGVISAEPDYRVYAAAEEQTTPEVDAAKTPAEEQMTPGVTYPNDLSAMQWDLADTSDIYTTPLSPTGGCSLEIPGWKEGRGDRNAPANASGTICIMDTGIDTDHPDLKGVLYEFTKEQQAKYGCGRYGYNASGDDRPVTEQKAVAAHGTHVAGIIAAEWNGEGVSGIAHGAKIFSVNVFGGLGSTQVMESVLKGFGFLIDVAQEVNLKAVNCSWGTVQPQFAFNTAIEELGKKGVNTVIASGNRFLDLDESIDLGSQTHSEFAVVVNASSPDGRMTDFSCWGQDSTDVFAPGGSILSTMPTIIQLGEGKNPDGYADNTRFYPEASPEKSILSIIGKTGSEEQSQPTEEEESASEEETPQPVTGIERFATDTPAVLFYDANPAMDPKARRIGEINRQNGFDDKRSMALRLAELPKEKQKEHGGYSAVNGYAYMAIPVTSAGDARWISVKTAMSDGFKPNGGIDSITCSDAGGKPVEIDSACAPALRKGCESGAFYPFYQCQWSVLSFNIQGYIEASNEAHELLGREMTGEEKEELLYRGLWDYRDPGEIKGIYEWEKGGQKYVIARIGMGMSAGEARQTQAAQQTTLFVDNVAVGDKSAFTGSYAIMSGTSMAAPAVAGCLAVIAANEPHSASMSDEQLAEAARERAAKLLASVDYDDELASLCRTGGRVNLHGKTEFTAKAPLISKVEAQQADGPGAGTQRPDSSGSGAGQADASAADGPGAGALQQNAPGTDVQQQKDSVTVEGWYFGSQAGTVAIDEREVEVLAWEDGKIRANISGIPNGSHVVKVTNADGAVSRAVFSTSSASAQGRRLFEKTHSLPLNEQAFMENHCDRIYESITACGGKIYTFAVSAKYRTVQGLWSYSIEEDKWAPCALPEDFYYEVSCGANQLASFKDRLYLYGSAAIPDEDGGIKDKEYLWRYEPYGDFWEKLDIDMPGASAGICVLGDALFAVGGY